MTTPPPRISYLSLDAWRGIASLMVVLYHTAGVHELHHPELKGTPLFWLTGFGWLGVQLFFVISGFCIANAAVISLARDPGVGSFFIARLRRIFPAYWCALILYLLLLQVLMRGEAQGDSALLSLPTVLRNFTLTQYAVRAPSILPVSWTLCYELAFYLLVGGVLTAVGRRFGARVLLRGLHLLTLLCIAAQLGLGFFAPYPFNLWPHFGFGVLVYDLLTAPKQREPRLWAVGVVVAELLLLIVRDHQVAEQPLRLSSAVALLFSLVLIVLHRSDVVLSKQRALGWLTWIGGFSYSLYLTHYFILRIGLRVFDKLHLPDPAGVGGLLVGTGISVAVAAVFYRVCEKPFLKKRPAK